MRSRFNEMIDKTDPPEPTCPRCGAYIDVDEFYENENWSCDRCGFSGEEDFCMQCDVHISPSSPKYGTSVCERCEHENNEKAYEDGAFDDPMLEQLFENLIDEEGSYWEQ